MTIVVATLGSVGDLHPFLAVARAVAERGHDVLFLSQEPHRAEVEAQGLRFEAIVSAHDHHRTMSHPDLWHPVRGFGVLWRHLAVVSIDPTIAVLRRMASSRDCRITVFASPLVVGARLATDILPIRLISGETAPAALRSLTDPMFVGPWRVGRWVPHLVRRWLWRLLDRYKLQPMAVPTLNAWRTRHGLPALAGPVFDKWIHSPECIVAMFPRDFCPPATDWPERLVQCGFPLFEPGCPPESKADPELTRFVSERTAAPLVVLYAGSTPTRQREVMQRIARSLSLKSVRCLLLGFESDTASGQGYILSRSSVRLPDILPHATLFIHHGGIGAIAQGYASGTVQLGLPSAYDQFDNCERLRTSSEIARATPIVRRNHRAEDWVPDLLSNLPARSPDSSGAQLAYSLPKAPNASVRTIANIILGEE